MNEQHVVETLASIRRPTEIEYCGGRTTLVSVRTLPVLDKDQWRVDLAGEWQCRRWPFDADEAAMAAAGPEPAEETLAQPGKVFYQDPDVDPGSVADWNRVSLSHVDADDGAMLWRRVRVPADWAGRRVLLRFDAVYPAARFWCNGVYLGEHLAGLIPVEFDITTAAAAGEGALIAVRLLRRHELVRMDMPRHAMEFAGISQPAYLHSVAACHVSELDVRPSFDAGESTGQIDATLRLTNTADGPAKARVSVRLSRDGAAVGQWRGEGSIAGHGESEMQIALDAVAVSPWSDEDPVLYDLSVEVEAAGQPVQRLVRRVGFRRLDVSTGRPMLNGRFVKFRGVNFLTFSPDGGMALSPEWIRRNLELMKRCNINAIRTHFTAPTALADLCDEMGFYLLQEITIDWVSELLERPEYLGPALMRVDGVVRRDRGHASLIGFTIGNENQAASREGIDTYWSTMRVLNAAVKRLQPSAITLLPPPGPANKIKHMLETRVADVADLHYSFVDVIGLREGDRLTEPDSWQGPQRTLTRDELAERGWSGVWFSSEWGIVNYLVDVLNGPYLSIIADRPENPLSGKNTQWRSLIVFAANGS